MNTPTVGKESLTDSLRNSLPEHNRISAVEEADGDSAVKHYHRAIDAVTRHTSIEYLFHNMIAIIHPDLGIGTQYNSYPKVQLLTSLRHRWSRKTHRRRCSFSTQGR